MKKLTLNLEELKVVSFSTSKLEKNSKGTVRGNNISHCNPPVCDSDVTYPPIECNLTALVSCNGTCYNTCNATCEESCNGTCYNTCNATCGESCNICPTENPIECPSVIPHHCKTTIIPL